MAVLELNALSTALSGSFSATVIFPGNASLEQDRKYPALYLLHDMGGNDTDVRTVKNLEALADELGVFIIAPSLMHSFGLDLPWGGKYGRFVYEELPGICRHMFPLDESRQFVGGVGSGAYGAYMNASEHPEVFRGFVGINGHYDAASMTEAAADGASIPHLTIPNLEAVFGNLRAVRGSRFDILDAAHPRPTAVFVGCEEESITFGIGANLANLCAAPLHTGKREEDLFAAAMRWMAEA